MTKKPQKNPKFEFTNERLIYFMKFTIQHAVYVVEQSVSPKMFTNERLFTIQVYCLEIPLYFMKTDANFIGTINK